MGLCPSLPFLPLVPLALLLAHVLLLRPYESVADNFRCALNVLTMCAATALRFFAFSVRRPPLMAESWALLLLLAAFALLPFLVSLWALIDQIHQIVRIIFTNSESEE